MNSMHRIWLAIAVASLPLATQVARPAAAQSETRPPPPASDTDPVIPEKVKPPNAVPGVDPDKPLSKQLEQSNGTITPPGDVDPKMHKPTPGVTNDPIAIPPPGSPGGPKGEQPK